MKQLTIEQKAQRYDEALKRAKNTIEVNQTIPDTVECVESLFPELKENNDEQIRKEIIDIIDSYDVAHLKAAGLPSRVPEYIAWLEKQDYTFEIKAGHWYKCVCDYMLNSTGLLMFKNDRLYYCRRDWRLRGEIDERSVKDIGVHGYKSFFRPATNQEIKDWIEKQGEQKLCMIQWKGNNLKEVIDFTGKDKNFDKWFKSFEEYEEYVHEHNNIFKLFNKDDSHYEVPVGAWIVKTPDGYNIASKAILKQKHNKGESKFKIGDWIVYKDTVWKVYNISLLNYYELLKINNEVNTKSIEDVDETAHLWTVQDVRNGDILVDEDNNIGLYREEKDDLYWESYLYLGSDGELRGFNIGGYHNNKNTKPATKEQRDTLFAKMKEAGFKWVAELVDKINIR